MLPVGNKPVIQHIVEALVIAGITDIIIVTSPDKKPLEDYFKPNLQMESFLEQRNKSKELSLIRQISTMAHISFVYQYEQRWVGHAMVQAKEYITDDFFMVLNGDIIYHPDSLQDMLHIHRKEKKSTMLLMEVPWSEINKRGIAKIQSNRIIGFVEKPATKEESPSNYANVWCIIYPKKILEKLEKSLPEEHWEIYPWDALQEIMQNEGVCPCFTNLPQRDTGNRESWFVANKFFLEKESL